MKLFYDSCKFEIFCTKLKTGEIFCMYNNYLGFEVGLCYMCVETNYDSRITWLLEWIKMNKATVLGHAIEQEKRLLISCSLSSFIIFLFSFPYFNNCTLKSVVSINETIFVWVKYILPPSYKNIYTFYFRPSHKNMCIPFLESYINLIM